MKTLLAAFVGYLLWTFVWIGGNALLRAVGITPTQQDAPITALTPLVALLLLSGIASLGAGWTTAKLAPGRWATGLLAAALLATGVLVQWTVRDLLPLWYHGCFLVLLLPLSLLGAQIPRRATGTDAAAK